MKLLLVEDEPGILLKLYRTLSGSYQIDSALNGQAALRKIASSEYAIIILDLHLPGTSDLEVCERIRSNGITTPILILSNVADITSKVTLLDSGANDYLTKPFHRQELEARLRVLTRSLRQYKNSHSRIVVGDLVLDTNRYLATRAGVPLPLRRKEFILLECLMQNAGTVVTREILAAHVWSDEPDALNNTIHVHINHLRDKVDRPFKSPLIRTIHGLGYKINTSKLVTSKESQRQYAHR